MTERVMRAKLYVSAVTKHDSGTETISFYAVGKKDLYDETGLDEDNTFAKYSPCRALVD